MKYKIMFGSVSILVAVALIITSSLTALFLTLLDCLVIGVLYLMIPPKSNTLERTLYVSGLNRRIENFSSLPRRWRATLQSIWVNRSELTSLIAELVRKFARLG